MAKRPLRLTNLPVAALGIVAIGVGAAAMTLGSSDTVVERGFERALASRAEQPNAMKIAAPAVAGSEQFWLTHVVHDASAPFTKPVAVGDRVTISSGGHDQVLHVVTVDKLELPAHSDFVGAPDPASARYLSGSGEPGEPARPLPDRSRRRIADAGLAQGGPRPLSCSELPHPRLSRLRRIASVGCCL